MEGVSASVYKGIKGYWRRNGYERLNTAGRKRKPRSVQLAASADGSPRRRRFWRIKLTRRLKFKLRFSPKKLLLGIRDAYVSMMMKIANSRMLGTGYGYGGGGDGVSGFGMRPFKEYDERMIVEIYKSIVAAQGQLVPRDAAWIGSEITCKRLVVCFYGTKRFLYWPLTLCPLLITTQEPLVITTDGKNNKNRLTNWILKSWTNERAIHRLKI